MTRKIIARVALVFLGCQLVPPAMRGQTLVEQFPRYDLAVKVLPIEHRLEVTGTVRLPASSGIQEELLFDLDRRMRDLQVEVVEPEASKGAAAVEKRGRNQWSVRPASAIPAGQAAALRFSYAGGEESGPRFYIGPEGSFASAEALPWYPRPAGVIRATGDLQFSAPAGYTVIATNTSGSLPVQPSQGRFLFKVTRPTTFSFAAGQYQVQQKSGGVPLSLYLLRPREGSQRYLDTCARILAVLVREFGAFPYDNFALVEAPDKQARETGFGGVSFEGFALVRSESIDAFNLALVSHEMSHQWWADSIKAKGPRGGQMLTEAMAQFGALRVVEEMEGAAVAERFRRTGYPGYEFFQNGLGYLMLAAAGSDHKLAEMPGGFVSHELADSKGFLVWDMLSRTIGREKFRQILSQLTQRYAFQNVVWDDFLREIEAGAGRDLQWFYSQWFERSGAPEWKLTWKQEGKMLRGTITQSPPYYRAAIEAQAEGHDYQRLGHTIEIAGPKTEFAWPVDFRVSSVTLDPHFQVLSWSPEYRAQAEALLPFTKAILTAVEGNLAQAHQDLQAALERTPEPDQYGAQFQIEFGQAVLFNDEGKPAEARQHLEAALASAVRRADLLPYAYYLLASLVKAAGDQAAFRKAVSSVITAEAVLGVRTGWADAARGLLVASPAPK